MSHLFNANSTGLFANSGRMLSKRASWKYQSKKNPINNLFLNRLLTLFTNVHHVHNGSPQMGERGYGLHFDRVALLQRLIEYSGRVNYLDMNLNAAYKRTTSPATANTCNPYVRRTVIWW
jgi:hypothetical protein